MSIECPQLEDGFTPVANTIMEPICHTRLSGTDWAFLHFLWRKTYGWSKPSDIISLSQFCEGTSLTQAHVCRTIKRLLAMNVIFRHVARIGNGETATYEFNKRIWSWKSLPKLATLPELAIQPLPTLAHTTERSTTTTKVLKDKDCSVLPKLATPDGTEEVMAYLNEKMHAKLREPHDLPARLKDGYTVEDCKKVIDIKYAEWHGGEHEKYIRPSTLFRKGHFDEYLNQSTAIKDTFLHFVEGKADLDWRLLPETDQYARSCRLLLAFKEAENSGKVAFTKQDYDMRQIALGIKSDETQTLIKGGRR
jgi:phage replication O-like protein O